MKTVRSVNSNTWLLLKLFSSYVCVGSTSPSLMYVCLLRIVVRVTVVGAVVRREVWEDLHGEDGWTRRICFAGYRASTVLQQLCRNGYGTVKKIEEENEKQSLLAMGERRRFWKENSRKEEKNSQITSVNHVFIAATSCVLDLICRFQLLRFASCSLEFWS